MSWRPAQAQGGNPGFRCGAGRRRQEASWPRPSAPAAPVQDARAARHGAAPGAGVRGVAAMTRRHGSVAPAPLAGPGLNCHMHSASEPYQHISGFSHGTSCQQAFRGPCCRGKRRRPAGAAFHRSSGRSLLRNGRRAFGADRVERPQQSAALSAGRRDRLGPFSSHREKVRSGPWGRDACGCCLRLRMRAPAGRQVAGRREGARRPLPAAFRRSQSASTGSRGARACGSLRPSDSRRASASAWVFWNRRPWKRVVRVRVTLASRSALFPEDSRSTRLRR